MVSENAKRWSKIAALSVGSALLWVLVKLWAISKAVLRWVVRELREICTGVVQDPLAMIYVRRCGKLVPAVPVSDGRLIISWVPDPTYLSCAETKPAQQVRECRVQQQEPNGGEEPPLP